MEQLEILTRGVAFGVAFLTIASWELVRPRRLDSRRATRWPINLSLAAVNSLVVRLIAPASGVTFALWAERRGWGVLRLVDLPAWVEWGVAILVLDAAVYFQHRLFHAIPLLWKLHVLHHADQAFDVSTGVRFHPGEIAISTLYKGAIIAGVGASPGATVAFEVVLNLGSLFSHANGQLPGDRVLRGLVVTPDMHRVHHSTRRSEQNSNFGFSFSWWDRLFGTYRPQPAQPHESMKIGVDHANHT
jgi:sterol desaturase/sphingolipid hydroxylase (fatty acid hydroxylase superfamily)